MNRAPHQPELPGFRFVLVLVLIFLAVAVWQGFSRSVPFDRAESVRAGSERPTVRIDLNSADVATLTLLPGIGEGLAGRIVEDREKIGRFESIESLGRVPGIGPKTIDRIRALVVVK